MTNSRHEAPALPHPPLPFIFFVGAERSGTTLVRAMFDSHSQLAVPPESYFFLFSPLRRATYSLRGRFDRTAFARDLLANPRFTAWGLPDACVLQALERDRPRSYPAALRSVYTAYAQHHGKVGYGDKSPQYVHWMPRLARWFPDAVFVHIIRDGRDVAPSLWQQPFGPRTLVTATYSWQQAVAAGQRAGQVLGPRRYYELHYETLVAAPEETLQALCGWLGLAFEPQMLHYHERATRLLPLEELRGIHRGVMAPITTNLRNWRTQLPTAQVETIEALAARQLRACGYETGPTPSPWRRLRAQLALLWQAHVLRWARRGKRGAQRLSQWAGEHAHG